MKRLRLFLRRVLPVLSLVCLTGVTIFWSAAPGNTRTSNAVLEKQPSGANINTALMLTYQEPSTIESVERDPLLGVNADPFHPVSFLPPQTIAPAPPEPAALPEQKAPPFPYRYFGRMIGPEGVSLTYLVRDDKLFLVRVQEIIEKEYRIDTITDTQIGITYLPMNETTVVPTRATNE